MNAALFGDLFQFIRNGMNVKQNKSGDGLPISRIETISDGLVNPEKVGFAGLTGEAAKGWLLEPGDILFSHINSVDHVGKCAVYRGIPGKLVHGMNLLNLRCDQSKISHEFAKYLIRSPGFRGRLANFINKAVNQASVSIGNLRTIPVTLPPLPAQRRIAAILDQADALRAKRREALTQLDSLTQSIFIEMFGDPVINPRGFPVAPLTDVCHCYSGGTPSKANAEFWGGDVPWFSAKDMKGTDLFDSLDHIHESVTRSTNLKLLPPNTVAIVVRGMILAHTFPVCVLRVPATINQDLKALIPRQAVQTQFLACCLRSQSKAVLEKVSEAGHGTKRLDTEGLRQIKVLLPAEGLQQDFANRIQAIESLQATHRAALAESNALFASLQHRAFAGAL